MSKDTALTVVLMAGLINDNETADQFVCVGVTSDQLHHEQHS